MNIQYTAFKSKYGGFMEPMHDFRGEALQKLAFTSDDCELLRAESADVSGMVLNNCAFEIDEADSTLFRSVLDSKGVLLYKPIFTKGKRIDTSTDFSFKGITWKYCHVSGIQLGQHIDSETQLLSVFKQTEFEDCIFGLYVVLGERNLYQYPKFEDCVFERSVFRSGSMLEATRGCYIDACIFDQVSIDLKGPVKVCSVVDHGLVFAMHRNPNKQPKSLGELSTFKDCTFRGLRPIRRTRGYDTRLVVDRFLRFPQSGIETCTFDVFFPAQDVRRKYSRAGLDYDILEAEHLFVFEGSGIEDPRNPYPKVFENSDQCRTLLDVLEMNNLCEQYIGIELSALKRAKIVIFRLWQNIRELHLVGVERTKDITRFGIERTDESLQGCLSDCIFEKTTICFYPPFEEKKKEYNCRDSVNTYYTTFMDCDVQSPNHVLIVGDGSEFRECALQGNFRLCTYVQMYGDNPKLKNCDLRFATIQFAVASWSDIGIQDLQKVLGAIQAMFEDCLVGRQSSFSVVMADGVVELDLQSLLDLNSFVLDDNAVDVIES